MYPLRAYSVHPLERLRPRNILLWYRSIVCSIALGGDGRPLLLVLVQLEVVQLVVAVVRQVMTFMMEVMMRNTLPELHMPPQHPPRHLLAMMPAMHRPQSITRALTHTDSMMTSWPSGLHAFVCCALTRFHCADYSSLRLVWMAAASLPLAVSLASSVPRLVSGLRSRLRPLLVVTLRLLPAAR